MVAKSRLCNPAFIGQSPQMAAVRRFIAHFAPHRAPVLLTGETGTGKDIAAQALATTPSRPGQPFIPINCGALNPQLIESELFGHERGAFTGATGRKRGAFEIAHGGTLFLDEVGELPLPLQAQLLRVLESGEIRPVGACETLHVQTRVIAATNRNLEREVGYGAFRADLFHRLHVLALHLPPLRHHLEDLLELAAYFLQLDSPAPLQLSPAAAHKLLRHSYPGNVRELRNVLRRALLLAEGPTIESCDIQFAATVFDVAGDPAGSRTLQEIEREAIIAELKRQHGNRKAAAQVLGVSRSTLHRRLHELGLTPAADHCRSDARQ